MPLVTAQELIDAGVHYGHQASRWNPKMKPFIHGKRHKIHVINLEETIRGLYQATHFVRSLAATGAQIMFLGTKKQIRPVVEAEAGKCNMPSVTERWIGGTLTNFSTVRERLTKLVEYENLETTGAIEKYKKKDQSMIRRDIKRIRRNLDGVRDLHGLPGALVVIDPRREENAMREAKRMNVPVVCILDTDCDPSLADIVIPANDDAMSSVQLILSKLAEAVMEGRSQCDEATLRDAQKAAKEDVRCKAAPGRRNERDGRGGGMRRGGGGGAGGRGGRGGPGGGRFQAGGHASSVSLGGDKSESGPAIAPEIKPVESSDAEAPAAEAPATEAPAAEAPATEAPAPAPEAPAADAPAPEAPSSDS
ncbi:MAG: 30S ribosomal protein S2 [Planctomycetota bacterium]|nr:30S ribosomal protein S2 [Planctomycetota bacterium]